MQIIKANTSNAEQIAQIGSKTFLEAHSTSGPVEDLNNYLNEKFSIDFIKKELSDPLNIFHVLSVEGQVVGYSKINYNSETTAIHENKNACKLERLYISAGFYGKKLGYTLFEFNKQLAIENGQSGFWLTVWVENERAIAFYEKLGFKIVGEMLFKVSNTYNPNYIMWLEFSD